MLRSFDANAFPSRRINGIAYREAGAMHTATLPIVLLHGIGSGAASWVQQLDALGAKTRVLAWDAPGYGESMPVVPASPQAIDYADALRGWLDALDIERCVLVGHSLGAIIAGSFAATHPERIGRLLLLSPAGGYGAASEALRTQKRDSRLKMLEELGPQGLADQRSGNMLSAHASEEAKQWVRWNMARVIPHGYAQATHLLANADLKSDVARFDGRVKVAVGSEDRITPPEACDGIAQAAGVTLQVIKGAGHAGYIEQPEAYNNLIEDTEA
jgi:pimeloyl-ACP methyl ester carboxylesterase